MEGNASVYQVNPVGRVSGEGRAEVFGTWGPDFDQKGGGRGGEGAWTGWAGQFLHFVTRRTGGEKRGFRLSCIRPVSPAIDGGRVLPIENHHLFS